MANYYYGAVTSIAWALGHFYFNNKHYAYLAREYYPYRLKNPQSSNPHIIYQSLYEPWRESDDFNRNITGYRLSLLGAVSTKQREGVVDQPLAKRLSGICDKVNIVFFYPVILRVDIDKISSARKERAGSGIEGSLEYLIRDLDESEIDEVLFLDFEADEDFKLVIKDEYYSSRETGRRLTEPDEVLQILERRCDSSGLQLPVSAT